VGVDRTLSGRSSTAPRYRDEFRHRSSHLTKQHRDRTRSTLKWRSAERTKSRCGDRSAAEQTHDFSIGEHAPLHCGHHALSIARCRNDLRYIQCVDAKLITVFSQRRTRRQVGSRARRINADVDFFLGKLSRLDGAFHAVHASWNVVQNPMSVIPKAKARRWTVPICRDQYVGPRAIGHTFPRHLGRYTLALAGIRGRNIAARIETDAMQKDGVWNGSVIGPIGISRTQSAHIRKGDDGRRQRENRDDYFAEELHVGRVAKLAPDGLLGAARLALRVALKGDRRHCVASSNPIVYVVGSTI